MTFNSLALSIPLTYGHSMRVSRVMVMQTWSLDTGGAAAATTPAAERSVCYNL